MKIVAVSGVTTEEEGSSDRLRVARLELTFFFIVGNARSTPDAHLLEGACRNGDEGLTSE